MLQGALDGGLDIPHNEKRFVGYDADAKEFDAESMKKYIFGGHVAEYMESMEEEEPEKFKAHFANYLSNDVEADADEIEEMYGKVSLLGWRDASVFFLSFFNLSSFISEPFVSTSQLRPQQTERFCDCCCMAEFVVI